MYTLLPTQGISEMQLVFRRLHLLASISSDFKISALNYAELMLANVLVYTPHLFMFETLSKHSEAIRAEK